MVAHREQFIGVIAVLSEGLASAVRCRRRTFPQGFVSVSTGLGPKAKGVGQLLYCRALMVCDPSRSWGGWSECLAPRRVSRCHVAEETYGLSRVVTSTVGTVAYKLGAWCRRRPGMLRYHKAPGWAMKCRLGSMGSDPWGAKCRLGLGEGSDYSRHC